MQSSWFTPWLACGAVFLSVLLWARASKAGDRTEEGRRKARRLHAAAGVLALVSAGAWILHDGLRVGPVHWLISLSLAGPLVVLFRVFVAPRFSRETVR